MAMISLQLLLSAEPQRAAELRAQLEKVHRRGSEKSNGRDTPSVREGILHPMNECRLLHLIFICLSVRLVCN